MNLSLRVILILVLGFWSAHPLLSLGKNKTYTTREINTKAPVVDGRPDEPVWDRVEWGTDFTQKIPYEGEKPSQETAFKILFDKKNLYVAIRAFDTEPGKIVRRICRRDNRDGDWVEVIFDSYYDRRTGFSFSVNAAGVKTDILRADDGQVDDFNWDPVWYAKTARDNRGWTAEMKIPLSQLRFDSKGDNIWGLHVVRFLYREQEKSEWQMIPRNAYGFISLFGELKGLQDINPRRQVELLPYAVAKHERFEAEAGNPFATGKLSNVTGGLDGKIGVTNYLTLDFTINPDFGQVEADPSEVNLTAFETFFDEKRPFFVEGSNIFLFDISGNSSESSWDAPFYSRRIGRTPQHRPLITSGEYAGMPETTSILGAFKLSGKTRSGFSIGILDSITAKESATIDFLGLRREEAVEPLTNYFVGRIQKDFNKGNTTVGGIFTATNRHLGDQSQLNFLHRSAYSGGLDFTHSWKEKEWFVYGTLIFSRVKGDKEAILNTQKSPVRYFQRPDADHLTLDPERTSLSGHGGSFFVGKVGGGRFQGVLGVTWRSPGLEFNDIGYLRSADRIFESLWLNYRINKPFSIFRRVSLSFDQGKIWNSAGTGISGSIEFRSDLYFKNYWTFESSIARQGDFLDTTAMRGGPALKLPGQWEYEFSAHSDKRKRFHFGAGLRLSRGDNNTSRGERYSGDITFRPSNALSISLEPGISYSKHDLQYVSTEAETGAVSAENRYIFAAIDQKTVDITVRIDYSITPDLSIQFYGQPFIASGKYTNFKLITQPRAAAFNDRFYLYGADEITHSPGEHYYYVSEMGGGPSYKFFDPNFKILEFRSNLVLRWEYIPGSTLYLVWSQGRSDYMTDHGRFDFRGGMRDLFHTPPHDVFLLKFTYRFNI